jgi:uncharacterized phage infection (PIP) family protein YhgE
MRAVVKTGLLAVVAAVIALSIRPVSAQDLPGLQKLAKAIEKNAHDLNKEIDDNFKPLPAYKQLNDYVVIIEKTAKTICKMVDDKGGKDKLKDPVNTVFKDVHALLRVVSKNKKDLEKVSEKAFKQLNKETDKMHTDVHALQTALNKATDDFKRVQELAKAIEKNAGDLNKEIDASFKPPVAYEQLNDYVIKIEKVAKTISKLVDDKSGKDKLKEPVEVIFKDVHSFLAIVNKNKKDLEKFSEKAYKHLRKETNQMHTDVHALENAFKKK